MASVVIYSRIMFSILWLYDWICFVHNTKLKTLGITKNDGKKNLLRTDCWLVRNACNYLLWQKWKHSYSELVESLSGSQGTVDYPIIHFAGCRQVHLESHLAIIEASYIEKCIHVVMLLANQSLQSTPDLNVSIFVRKPAGTWGKHANLKSTQCKT